MNAHNAYTNCNTPFLSLMIMVDGKWLDIPMT